jgi:phosphatidate cytidylyltransferase
MMSAVMVSVAIGAIFFAPKWVFFLVIEAFILLGLNEFFCLAEKKGLVLHKVLGLFFGGLLPCSIYFASEPMILLLACLCFFVFNFRQKFREQALLSVSVTFFGIVYISWFFSFLNKIHYLPGGATWTFYVILLVKGGDAGAYFIGKRFGRIKLAEHISPNKSVEGAIGGFLTTVLLSFLSAVYLPNISFVHLAVMGVMVAILSQLGDLVESLIKRDVGVKDSGHVPGLGGILDVLDSLLLSVPFVYYYITSFANLV